MPLNRPLNRPTNYLLRSAGSTEFTNTTLEPIREETIHQEVPIEIHQEDQQVMNNPAEVNNQVNLSSVNVQPNRYNGCTKPDIWLKQFNRWKRLQNLSNEQACNALSFYLEGSSKLWYEGVTDEIQNDYDALQNALIERFKNAYEDDDILLAQLPAEKAVEYLDRLQIKARHQDIPSHLLIRIAKQGLKPSLRSIIIQRDPKTLEELKTAAIIAEKCLQEKSQEDSPRSQVNAISNNDFQMLNDTIKALSKKVENLGFENEQLREKNNYRENNAGANWSRNWGSSGQKQTDRKSFGNPQFNNRQNFTRNSRQASCTQCGDSRCSGKQESCFASNKKCAKCLKIGHFARMCRSIYNINGEKIGY